MAESVVEPRGLGEEAGPPAKPKARRAKAKVAKAAKPPNPCFGATLTKVSYPTSHIGVRLPFKPSTAGLKRYLVAKKHKPVMNWREDPPRITFDDTAVARLIRNYKDDPLYPLLERQREAVKCLGTYVNGLPVSADGRVHEVYKHTPETLRLAMQVLQTLPNPNKLTAEELKDSLYARVRGLFIAAPGHTLLSRDYGGIEAKLVGYLAEDKDFTRLCSLGIHDFVASHAIKQPADVEWDDGTLREWFARNKRDGGIAYDAKRDGCKRAVYLSLYGGGPAEMARRAPKVFKDAADAQWYQDLILGNMSDETGRRTGGLFPSIDRWHWRTAETAERQGYLLAPSGFRLHFLDTISYTFMKKEKRWERKLGEPAKEAIAGVPQHLAACQMAQGLALAWAEPTLSPYLRLSIHDELLLECLLEMCDNVSEALRLCMERPLPFMALPESWGMGPLLTITTDAKTGPRWSDMKKT